MPSLSPLSTLSPCRIREGTLGSVTTACPSAASVGASTIASKTASMNASSPSTATPASAPATIVSGSPIASRRSGTTYSRRKTARSMRDASEKSTTVNVASAIQRTVELSIVGSSQPRTSPLTRMPPATNTIAAVMMVPESRRETAAYTITRSASATRPEPPNAQASVIRRPLPRSAATAWPSRRGTARPGRSGGRRPRPPCPRRSGPSSPLR